MIKVGDYVINWTNYNVSFGRITRVIKTRFTVRMIKSGYIKEFKKLDYSWEHAIGEALGAVSYDKAFRYDEPDICARHAEKCLDEYVGKLKKNVMHTLEVRDLDFNQLNHLAKLLHEWRKN
jgi:hypothetical protein